MANFQNNFCYKVFFAFSIVYFLNFGLTIFCQWLFGSKFLILGFVMYSIHEWSWKILSNHPPGSKSEALRLGVHLILLYFDRISILSAETFFYFDGRWRTFWFCKYLSSFLVYSWHVYVYIYIYIKYICAHQFCYGFNIGNKLETWPTVIKITISTWFFLNHTKSIGFYVVVWRNIFMFNTFLFWLIFKGIYKY